jgi:predicted metal-binding membrane protein
MAASGEGANLERLLRRDRAIAGVALTTLCALAWLYLLSGAGLGRGAWGMTKLWLFPHNARAPMDAMTMPGMAMPDMMMSTPHWSSSLWVLTVAMWWIMMVAMMTPSAAPAILLYARVRRHALQHVGDARPLASTGAFAAGYLGVWFGFSLAAAALYWGLDRTGLVSAAAMSSQSKWLNAALLGAAGAYQLSPLQNACLSHCRSPASFFSKHWRPGAFGAARLGALHGAYCVGCCWLLMALLFVGGVMNLAWIAALTLLVLAEKLLAGGRMIARASGLVLLAWATATLLV